MFNGECSMLNVNEEIGISIASGSSSSFIQH